MISSPPPAKGPPSRSGELARPALVVPGLAFDALGRRPRAGDALHVAGTELRLKAVADLRITVVELKLLRERQP